MSVLEKETQLHLHGVPSTAVDDLALASVGLGIVLQELHHFRPHCVVHAAGHPNIQKHLQHMMTGFSFYTLKELEKRGRGGTLWTKQGMCHQVF